MILKLSKSLKFDIELSEYEISSLFGILELHKQSNVKAKDDFLQVVASDLQGKFSDYLHYIQTLDSKVVDYKNSLLDNDCRVISMDPKKRQNDTFKSRLL